MSPTRYPKGTFMRVNRDTNLLAAFVGDPRKKDTAKISARKLARFVEVHPSFIDRLVSGKANSCTPKTARRISEALGLELRLLFVPSNPRSSGQIAAQQKAVATRIANTRKPEQRQDRAA